VLLYLTLLSLGVSTLQVPTEEEVTSFLEKCCKVARSMVETRLVATRSAAASSLGIDEYDLDKKFARNCVEERIKTLQDKVRLAHQQMQGIQQEAEGAAAAAEARCAEGALVQRNLKEEVARLRMRGKLLDAVPQEVQVSVRRR
jgi:hypothetical protein